MKIFCPYKYLFSGLVMLLPLFAYTQTGISGTVMDKVSGEKLAFVNILVVELSTGAASDIDGNFLINIPKGEYTLVFSSIGYKKIVEKVSVPNGVINLQISMNLSSEILNTVVVSASKYKQRMEESTNSMEVIKPKMLDNKAVTSIDKAIEQVPGITVVDNEPQMRGGSGFSSGLGSRVAVLVDGMPILRGDAGRPVWNFLPMDNIDQIEILKGASSVVYGSSALNGAINIRTAYPGEKPCTKYKGYGGLYSKPQKEYATHWEGFNPLIYGANLSHSRRIKNVDLVLGFDFFYDSGYIGPIPEDASDQMQIELPSRNDGEYENRGRFNFATRVRSKKIEGLTYGLSGNFMQSKNAQAFFWMDADTNMYRSYPGSLSNFNEFMYYLDPFVKYISPKGGEHSFKNRYFYSSNNADNDQSAFSGTLYNEYQYYNKLEKLGGLVVTAGLMNIYVKSTGKVFSGVLGENGENTSENAAVYLQLEKKFWKRLTYQLGGRWEYYKINDFEEDKPVFRTGLNLKIHKATYVRASIGQGYRYPSIAERYIMTKVGRFGFYPNPDLKSEDSWNAEIGIKQLYRIGGIQGFIDVAGFWQEYKDFVEFNAGSWGSSIDFSENLGFKFLNTGDARVRGIDCSIAGEWNFSEDMEITFMGGYTYTLPESLEPEYVFYTDSNIVTYQGVITDTTYYPLYYGNTSTDTTNHILKYRIQHLVKFDVEITRKKIFVGVSGRYYSFMRNIDKFFYDFDRPGYFNSGIKDYRELNDDGTFLFDLRVGYNFKENIKLSLIVNNLFNKEFSLRPLSIESPRTIGLQFIMRTF